ncbi:hypothetical protein BZM27_36620 [Paraburkholderia steynii]|uniref:Uncharacterized protein n=1 Tax=Paraburkholderia steynii TaxID=1245441 RepID=A0A4R0XG51_9BURK|nr:hypothetical protein BZM27_36620 [Paraburkholderia steynii]
MNYADQAAQDLVHIRAMILRLEHLPHEKDTGAASSVTSPDYWRARIEALSTVGLPPALEVQARALLARLDAISAASLSSTLHDTHQTSKDKERRPLGRRLR